MSTPPGLYAIVSGTGGDRLLVTPTPSGVSLPFVSLEPGEWSQVDGAEIKGVTRAVAAVEHSTGLRVAMLYRAEWPKADEDVRRVLRIQAFERLDEDAPPVAPYRWTDRNDAGALAWERPFMSQAVAAFSALADARERPVPWWAPGWTRNTLTWIDDRLTEAGMRRVGGVTQVKNDWQSVVMRAATDDGFVYLKALAPPADRELTILCDVLTPGPHVPRVLGVDQANGLLLMRDVGGVNPSECGRGAVSEIDLHRLAEGYATLQRSTARVDPESVFDCRLERVAELLSATLDDLPSLLAGSPYEAPASDIARARELIPVLARVCRAADRAGIPPHLVHADLDGNTVVTQDGPVFFDWAAGYVSHPFFDVYEFEDSIGNATDEPGTAAAIDRYLSVWTEYGSVEELRRIVITLRAVRWAPGLIKGAHCLRHLPHAKSPLRTTPYAPLSVAGERWQRGMAPTLRRLCDDLEKVT